MNLKVKSEFGVLNSDSLNIIFCVFFETGRNKVTFQKRL